jgi:hypothetical protein
MLSKRDRLLATVAHRKPDRMPVALWRNWPVDNKSPERLAQVTLDYQRRYDFDFIKVSPSHIFTVGIGVASASPTATPAEPMSAARLLSPLSSSGKRCARQTRTRAPWPTSCAAWT